MGAFQDTQGHLKIIKYMIKQREKKNNNTMNNNTKNQYPIT